MTEKISRSVYECVFYTKRLGLKFKFLRGRAVISGYDESEFLGGVHDAVPSHILPHDLAGSTSKVTNSLSTSGSGNNSRNSLNSRNNNSNNRTAGSAAATATATAVPVMARSTSASSTLSSYPAVATMATSVPTVVISNSQIRMADEIRDNPYAGSGSGGQTPLQAQLSHSSGASSSSGYTITGGASIGTCPGNSSNSSRFSPSASSESLPHALSSGAAAAASTVARSSAVATTAAEEESDDDDGSIAPSKVMLESEEIFGKGNKKICKIVLRKQESKAEFKRRSQRAIAAGGDASKLVQKNRIEHLDHTLRDKYPAVISEDRLLEFKYLDADVSEYVELDEESWNEFVEQEKKMLQLALGGERVPPAPQAVPEPVTAPVTESAEGSRRPPSPPSAAKAEAAAASASATATATEPEAPTPAGAEPAAAATEADPAPAGAPVASPSSARTTPVPAETPRPIIGSYLLSINHVKVMGLEKELVISLLKQQQRPMVMEFVYEGEGSGDATAISAAASHDSSVDGFGVVMTASDNAALVEAAVEYSTENLDGAPVFGGGRHSGSARTSKMPSTLDQAGRMPKRNNITYDLFMSKYNHATAAGLRKQMEKYIADFVDGDWVSPSEAAASENAIASKAASRSKSGSKEKEKNQPLVASIVTPAKTVSSFYRFLKIKLEELGLFDNSKPQGGGFPLMGEEQWDDVMDHIEAYVCSKIYTFTVGTLAMKYNLSADSSDSAANSFTNKLASLKFITLEHLGLYQQKKKKHKKDDNGNVKERVNGSMNMFSEMADEEAWRLAMKELCRALEFQSPALIMQRFVTASKIIAHATEAYVFAKVVQNGDNGGKAGRRPALDKQNSGFVLQKNVEDDDDSDNKVLAADELLPAMAWTVIQANPPNLDNLVWYCQEFRHPDRMHGEAAYSLAQLSSAIEFCKSISVESLDLTEEEYKAHLGRYEATQQLINACKRGDLNTIRKCLGNSSASSNFIPHSSVAGAIFADVNGFNPDQTDRPLSACIRFHQKAAAEYLLTEYADSIRVNARLSPCHGTEQAYTALHLAALSGQPDLVILLLQHGADRHLIDDNGHTPLSLAMSANHKGVVNILLADPRFNNLVENIVGNNLLLAEGLLLQGVDVNALTADETLFPLMAAVRCGNLDTINFILKTSQNIYKKSGYRSVLNVNQCNVNKETALMHIAFTETFNNKGETDYETLLPKIVSTLLMEGADRNVKTAAEGYKAVDFCRQELSRIEARFNIPQVEEGGPAGYIASAVGSANGTATLASNGSAKATSVPYFDVNSSNGTKMVVATPVFYAGNDQSSDKGVKDGNSGGRSVKQNGSGSRGYTSSSSADAGNGSSASAVHPTQEPCSTSITAGLRKHEGIDEEDAESFCKGLRRVIRMLKYDPQQYSICDASRLRMREAVESLLDQGVPLDTADPEKGFTPLIAAVFNEDFNMVRLLLEKGCKRPKGLTPTFSLSEMSEGNNSKHFSEGFTSYGEGNRKNRLDINRSGRHGMRALHYAAQSGNSAIVGILLQFGADRDLTNDQGHTAKHIATVNGHISAVNVLRYNPAEVPICLAAKHGDWVVAKALLQQGVSVNVHQKHYEKGSNDTVIRHDLSTPLIAAIAYKQFDFMRKLLTECAHSININETNELGETALMYAVLSGDENVVISLIKRGADRNAVDKNGRTALSIALSLCGAGEGIAFILRYDPSQIWIHDLIRKGDFKGVLALLKQGVDVNLPRYSDAIHPCDVDKLFSEGQKQLNTSSQAASIGERTPTQKKKSKNGSPRPNDDAPITDGEIPLTVAAACNRTDVINLLLKCPDLDINRSDGKGRNALFHACMNGQQEMVLLLLKNKANRKCMDFNRMSACDMAIRNGHLQIAAILQADPVHVHIHDVCAEGKLLLVKALLLQGCPVNYQDERTGMHRQTPLLAACSHGRTEVVELLAEEPALSYDLVDDLDRSPLMLAASCGALNITAFLLSKGCNRRLVDSNGMSATDYAYGHGMNTRVKFGAQLTLR